MSRTAPDCLLMVNADGSAVFVPKTADLVIVFDIHLNEDYLNEDFE
jgi:hypothetical protein